VPLTTILSFVELEEGQKMTKVQNKQKTKTSPLPPHRNKQKNTHTPKKEGPVSGKKSLALFVFILLLSLLLLPSAFSVS
jgi:cytoskeletal protein RodZ